MTLTDDNHVKTVDGSDDGISSGVGVAAAVPDELIDAVMANVDAGGVELLGPDGVLAGLTKRISSRSANTVV